MILGVARLLFDVRVRGSYGEVFVAVLVYLLGALGLGLLVSSVSHSQAMAFQVGSVVSILPAIFLSGFIFPIDAMPRAVQLITYAFPARYFLVILRGIVLKGAGLSAYPADLFFLVLYAVVVLALAWARLVRAEA
jgi:ABC-2 type transport system permease protein